MAVEFTQEVSDRLSSDKYGWLTTVAKSGQPVPRLVWFFFDGTDVIVYSRPNAAKVRHISAHPRVSLNLDSDGNGCGIIIVGGVTSGSTRKVPIHWPTSGTGRSTASTPPVLGLTKEFLTAYNTRLKISRRQGVDDADRRLILRRVCNQIVKSPEIARNRDLTAHQASQRSAEVAAAG